MTENFVERAIVPRNPAPSKVQNKEHYNLFSPLASDKTPGLASFNPDDFYIDANHRVSLRAKFDARNMMAGSGKGSVQQVQDQETNVTEGYFNFTGKNLNATEIDSSLTGEIQYGATGDFASSLGGKSAAMGKRATSRGTTTIAKGKYSDASGDNSVALGDASSAEGRGTTAVDDACHSEGIDTVAKGLGSHTQGGKTKTDANYASAGGYLSEALGDQSSAEGTQTKAIGTSSHTRGELTQAQGDCSCAGGYATQARGRASLAEGIGTMALGEGQAAVGRYNEPDEESLFIVGGGTSGDDRRTVLRVTEDAIYGYKKDGTKVDLLNDSGSSGGSSSNIYKYIMFVEGDGMGGQVAGTVFIETDYDLGSGFEGYALASYIPYGFDEEYATTYACCDLTYGGKRYCGINFYENPRYAEEYYTLVPFCDTDSPVTIGTINALRCIKAFKTN